MRTSIFYILGITLFGVILIGCDHLIEPEKGEVLVTTIASQYRYSDTVWSDIQNNSPDSIALLRHIPDSGQVISLEHFDGSVWSTVLRGYPFENGIILMLPYQSRHEFYKLDLPRDATGLYRLHLTYYVLRKPARIQIYSNNFEITN